MTSQEKTNQKEFTKGEVEILLALREIKVNQDIILSNYVKKSEFDPVQRIVYGLVGLVLIAVAGGVIAMVVS